MLTELSIQDFAIVDHLELELEGGMTAITGETGAGKSILLGALGLCLGERADAGSVRHGQTRADLSARFDITHLPHAQSWLANRELPEDDCLLRRVVTKSGRSKAWINGQPATIADLKSLGETLIEIHGQHAHQALLAEDTHLRLLDDLAGHRESVSRLAELYREWQSTRRQLKRLADDGDEIRARRQLLRYQVEELDQLGLGEEELEQLEREQELLAHAESRLAETQFALDCCDGEEGGALPLLHQASQRLAALPGSDKGALANAIALLGDASIQLEEAGRELHQVVADVELDPERLAWVEQRLGEAHRIARKHHVLPDEIVALHQRLTAELQGLEGGDEDLEALTEKADGLKTEWRTLAETVSAARHKAAKRFGKEVQQQLAFLAMGKARFEVEVSRRDAAAPEGMDRVRFLIAANPGPAAPAAGQGGLRWRVIAYQPRHPGDCRPALHHPQSGV